MCTIQSLKGVEISKLKNCFNDAFSDYVISMHLDLSQFEIMLKRKGFNPSLSFGAFVDGELVAFVLNALRVENMDYILYNLGTGVVPKYRRQGIVKNLMKSSLNLMNDQNYSKYILEVLKDNEKAIRLYEKLGFKVNKDFSCYRVIKSDIKDVDKKLRIDESDYHSDLTAINSIRPSWQNDVQSVLNVPHLFKTLLCYNDHEIIGYGVIQVSSGEIVQLAISENHRNKGYGSELLYALSLETSSDILTVINLDADYLPMNQFLISKGFEVFTKQYEMIIESKVSSFTFLFL